MRLIRRQSDGSFRLTNIDKHIPRYAILSHTWGSQDDEVNFHDISNGSGTTKPGYRKLEFCAKQAASDELDYFWIDTCCIDKSSSSELTEAINSMFRWYHNSAKCYALLDDVSIDGPHEVEIPLAFQKSRWFTRGWTLQELLAPKTVDFFSIEGHSLGNKLDRAQEIATATGIPIEALHETSLSHFNIDQRMLWANGRETTREEDMAYCLMGLCGVFMAAIYGEGQDHAFMRLNKKIRSFQEAHRSPGPEAKEDTTIALRSGYFHFSLQIPTMLPEMEEQYSLVMANPKTHEPPDLVAVKKTGTNDENIEIKVLYGAHRFQNVITHAITPNFTPLLQDLNGQLDCTLADWNGDGTLDLIVIKKFHTASNSTEVHVFSGASKFQHIMFQMGTVLGETDDTWTFGMGRWLGGQRPDLFAIKKAKTKTKRTEVHLLNGDMNYQQFIMKYDTGLHETGPEWDFIVADWNGDGIPDLVAVKKIENKHKYTEVHVLSGASKYREFILRAETPLEGSGSLFDFAVADWTGNGKPDLVAFKKSGTESKATEIHVMSQVG